MNEDEQTQERLISEKEAADMLGVTLRSLREWRRKKTGPTPIKFNSKTIRYRVEDLNAYIEDIKDEYDPED